MRQKPIYRKTDETAGLSFLYLCLCVCLFHFKAYERVTNLCFRFGLAQKPNVNDKESIILLLLQCFANLSAENYTLADSDVNKLTYILKRNASSPIMNEFRSCINFTRSIVSNFKHERDHKNIKKFEQLKAIINEFPKSYNEHWTSVILQWIDEQKQQINQLLEQ